MLAGIRQWISSEQPLDLIFPSIQFPLSHPKLLQVEGMPNTESHYLTIYVT